MNTTALQTRPRTRPHARTAENAREWGPAKHDPDHPLRSHTAAGVAVLRDGDDARPDDN
ncbi:hypothetical protein JK386_04835 [Nocardioides sp. zg-536]|uniref:Uncharacterized protein n=1 Tax=Nocardioides faecalis TaxID=2803858 RepID=A0A938Y6P0_9ACTN|nr:hypothetical protein [Nocardioides faecalis]MBM9459218.1 hypothetical protein [Nocardioides faecalis]QVI59645.1 hypothetical protein KG111_04680 [Nocardioides faecalis]